MISSEQDKKLTTGCRLLDNFLKGGLQPGQITEVYGESGVGKTCFGLQLLLNVQLPFHKGGLEGGALYISTSSRFSFKRLDQLFDGWLANYYQITKEEKEKLHKIAFDRIHVVHLRDLDTQLHFLRYQIPHHMKTHNIKLLVIDSITGNFRIPADGLVDQHRSKAIFETGEILHSLATSLSAVVLCINEVSAKFDRNVRIAHDSHGQSKPLSVPDDRCSYVPALGVALSVIVNSRIRIQRNPLTGDRSMHVVYSPYIASNQSCLFSLTGAGISAIQLDDPL